MGNISRYLAYMGIEVGGERGTGESVLSRGKNSEKRQWNETPDYLGSNCEELRCSWRPLSNQGLVFDVSLPMSPLYCALGDGYW